MLESENARICRCCLQRLGKRKKSVKLTALIQTRFEELTGIKMDSSGSSNIICETCNTALMNFSQFRRDVLLKHKSKRKVSKSSNGVSNFEFAEVLSAIKSEPLEIKSECGNEVFTLQYVDQTNAAELEEISGKIFEERGESVDGESNGADMEDDQESPKIITKDPETICPFCDKKYTTKYKMRNHVQKKHKELPGADVVDKKAKNQEAKIIGKNSQTTASGGESSGANMEDDLEESKIIDDPDTICPFCDKKYTTKYIMRKHVLMKHTEFPGADDYPKVKTQEVKVPEEASTADAETRVCPHCGKTFNRKYYNRHIKRIHSRDKTYVCDLCPKLFYEKCRISEHMFCHIPDAIRRTHACSICKRVFLSAGIRDKHVRDQHEAQGRNFVCKICSKTFKLVENLSGHMKCTHGEKKFKCDQCTLSFPLKGNLNEHIRNRHSVQPALVCDACGKTYMGRLRLQTHLKLMHTGRNFKCNFKGCTRKYLFERELRRHQKVHRNQKDYKCPHENCGKSYFHSARLRIHIRLIHDKLRQNCPVSHCKFFVGRYDYMRAHLLKHTELSKEKTAEHLATIKEMRKQDKLTSS